MTYRDMLTMVEREKKLRKVLLEGGVREAEKEMFENLSEEDRQCVVCKTVCFLSALLVKGEGTEGVYGDGLVCLSHFDSMDVDPSNIVLKYRLVKETAA